MLAAAVCGAGFALGRGYEANRPPETETRSVTLTDHAGRGQVLDYTQDSDTALPEPESPKNYRFVSWRDEEGKVVYSTEDVTDGAILTAEYMPLLAGENHHKAYFYPDENGFYFPNAPFTMGDLAYCFQQLAAADPFPDGGFADVEKSDPYYEGAGIIAGLDIMQGRYLHPHDALSAADIACYFAAFYPSTDQKYSFAGISEEDYRYTSLCAAVKQGWIKESDVDAAFAEEALSRKQAADMINRMIGRFPGADKAGKRKTGICAELAEEDVYYYAFLEAIVDHNARVDSKGGEKWITAKALKVLDEGPLFIGNRLYYVQPDHRLAIDCQVDGLDFGPDGAYTSGDAELDRVVLETLSKIVTEEMTQEEKLKAVFLYCAKEFKYLRRDYFDKGTTGWWREPAYIILTTGKGNCYNYNAAFCALGRALGYSFDVISGTVGKNRAPHGWCFIVEGEDTIVYDPELYMRHPERGSDFFFAMSPVVTRGWSYKTE